MLGERPDLLQQDSPALCGHRQSSLCSTWLHPTRGGRMAGVIGRLPYSLRWLLTLGSKQCIPMYFIIYIYIILCDMCIYIYMFVLIVLFVLRMGEHQPTYRRVSSPLWFHCFVCVVIWLHGRHRASNIACPPQISIDIENSHFEWKLIFRPPICFSRVVMFNDWRVNIWP